MIPEEFVTASTALLLLKAGYPDLSPTDFESGDCFNPPLQQSAIRWLRENKKLIVEVFYEAGVWLWDVFDVARDEYLQSPYETYDAYERAAEPAIAAACDYIIDGKS